MRVFCSVIEAGGFAAAADQLGISTSAVSRQVAQLEAHLNVRLLNRTTRRMSPTDEGFAYFERCTQLLADIEETEASVAGEARRPRGRLRLTAPMTLGILRLAPAFPAFSQQYPGITLDIALSLLPAESSDAAVSPPHGGAACAWRHHRTAAWRR